MYFFKFLEVRSHGTNESLLESIMEVLLHGIARANVSLRLRMDFDSVRVNVSIDFSINVSADCVPVMDTGHIELNLKF